MPGGGGGGGKTSTNVQPWAGAVPYLTEGLQGAQYAYQNPAPYYPGSTFVGPTPGEMAAWNQKLGYADQVFGGQQGPRYGDVTGAVSRGLGQGFGQMGTAGGLDARGAINSALSGEPDYTGLDSMAAAANAPILRQFNEEIIPGLNSRATFLNNPTGGIKTLNRVMPDIAQRMSENTMGLYNNERLRALASRDAAAGLVSNLGTTANSQALQAAGLFPSITAMGAMPGDLSGQFADWGRGFEQQALEDSMNRWNYYTGQPRENASWYLGAAGGPAGMGQTQTQQQGGGSKLAGALGGGIAGYGLASGLGSFLGPAAITNPIGLGIVGAGALLGSGLL